MANRELKRINIGIDDEYRGKLKILSEQTRHPPARKATILLEEAIDREWELLKAEVRNGKPSKAVG